MIDKLQGQQYIELNNYQDFCEQIDLDNPEILSGLVDIKTGFNRAQIRLPNSRIVQIDRPKFFDPTLAPHYQTLFEISANDKVIDIGGGHQPFPVSIYNFDRSLNGTAHRHPGAQKIATTEDSIHTVISDGCSMPLGEDSVGAVVLSHIIEHLDTSLAIDVINEARRVSKSGIYVEVPLVDYEKSYGYPYHLHLAYYDNGRLLIRSKDIHDHWSMMRGHVAVNKSRMNDDEVRSQRRMDLIKNTSIDGIPFYYGGVFLRKNDPMEDMLVFLDGEAPSPRMLEITQYFYDRSIREDVPDIHTVEDFINEVLDLGNVYRRGWVQMGMAGEAESLAEHIDGMLFELQTLPGEVISGVDLEKLRKMVIYHDIAEAITGDYTPLDNIPPEVKLIRERGAMREISQAMRAYGIDTTELIQIWEEYEGRSSRSALIVKALDIIQLWRKGLQLILDGQTNNTIAESLLADDQKVDYVLNILGGKLAVVAMPILDDLRKQA